MQEMKLLTTGTLSYWMTFCGGSWIFYMLCRVRSSGSGRGLNPKCGPMISSTTPNQSPREAGYANNGFSEISASFRVSRLLSLAVRPSAANPMPEQSAVLSAHART